MTAALMLSKIETEMLINLVKQLTTGNADSAEWQLQKLQQLGKLRTANVKMIASERTKLLEAVRAEITKTAYESAKLIDAGVKEAGKTTGTALPITSNPAIESVITSYVNMAANTFDSAFAPMLAKCDAMYTDTITKAVIKQKLGVSGRQAIAETCSEWSQQGLKALTDKAGRNWTTEAYAQTVLRSSSTKAATDTQFARMSELDEDLVEISSHIGARPKCAPYQGHIYSLSGKSTKYPALSSTSYGEPDGLFGINCRHIMYPYFEGTEKTYQPQNAERNESAYKNSQKQRAYERSIREAKRNVKIMSATKDKDQIANANELLAKRENALKSFISQTGRTRRTDREEIY